MPRSLKFFITGLVALSAVALVATSLVIPVDPRIALGVFGNPQFDILAGVAFWTVVTLLASTFPVQMPRGVMINTAYATLVAAMSLGGPTAAGWVALIGTTELRELSGRVPWYGTLANHAGVVLPAVAGAFVMSEITTRVGADVSPWIDFVAAMVGAAVFFVLNVALASITVSLRTGQSLRAVVSGDLPTFFGNWVALSPLAWLMAFATFYLGWWATLLFALPVWIMRGALDQIIEMRVMFTQTVASLAQAVDARSDWTSGHSQRVQLISVDIGRVMRRSGKELEALEWGGLLHDIGKIGVPDSVLDKPGFLTKEERAIMNAHPVIGASIIAPVTKLAPELPIIRHHHEWYNGSGYPDRLMGDEIPVLARILHVADAFEAMTAARPYRLTPLTSEQAMAELRKFAGIQFDPAIVDAFTKTHWAADINDPGRATEPRPPVPLLAQAAGRMAQAGTADVAGPSAVGTNPAGPSAVGTNPAGTNPADSSAEGMTAPAPDPAS
jgi:HD-GYP domain-containing protein (c-di-GMP phosphodiesterase class II)